MDTNSIRRKPAQEQPNAQNDLQILEQNLQIQQERLKNVQDRLATWKKDNKWRRDRIPYLERKIKILRGEQKRLIKHGLPDRQKNWNGIQNHSLKNLIEKNVQDVNAVHTDLKHKTRKLKRAHRKKTEPAYAADTIANASKELGNLKLQTVLCEEKLIAQKKIHAIHSNTVEELEDIRQGYLIALPQIKYEIAHQNGAPKIAAKPEPNTNTFSLKNLKEWANKNLKGRVHIDKRIYKNLLRTEFNNYQYSDLVFQSLEVLANEFWEQKMSGDKSEDERKSLRKAFEEKVRQLELGYGQSITDTKYKKNPAYYTQYEGRIIFLGKHFTKGGGFDVRNYFREYFEWDKESQKVIVGYLPDHLPNDIS